MTSVEPGIIDANVLIYAMDADHPHHAASRVLLDAARNSAAILYVTPQILCEFYSIVTNPRRIARPRSSADAMATISSMLAFLQPCTGCDSIAGIDAASSGNRRRRVRFTDSRHDADQ
jgi:predicted nucleic acid-binding protein